MTKIVLEVPDDIVVPSDLDSEGLIDALMLLRKLFGSRKPKDWNDSQSLGRLFKGLSKKACVIDDELVLLRTSIERTVVLYEKIHKSTKHMLDALSNVSDEHPWFRSGEAEAKFEKRYVEATQSEKRMLYICDLVSGMELPTTQLIKTALNGTLGDTVIQKDYNFPKVEDFKKKNSSYVDWYLKKDASFRMNKCD